MGAAAGSGRRSARSQGEFSCVPHGPFSLRQLALLGFGHRVAPAFDGVLRLAFCVDGYRSQVGVEARQDDAGVHCVVRWPAGEPPDPAVVRAQVARILSLDQDGDAFAAVGDRDPVVRRLLDAAPGLRPLLFHSPYEAAAWSVLSARRPAPQMVEVRRRLCGSHGSTFELAGEVHAAFPTPTQLLEVTEVPGLTADKVARLHAVARAALRGRLDAHRLARMDASDAMTELQSIPGIGPFYSALIVIRSTGCTDVLPTDEPRFRDLVTALYGLQAAPTADDLAEIAQPWQPFRTWVAVLVRAAGPRVLGRDREPVDAAS